MDDRAYYYNRFYRHIAFKSKSSCLRFAQNIGYFRRHDDVLKRLSCLQLKFSSFLAAGMMADFQLNVPTLENARWRQLNKAPVFPFLLCYNNMTFKRECGENVTPSGVYFTSIFMPFSDPVHHLNRGICLCRHQKQQSPTHTEKSRQCATPIAVRWS